MKPRRWLRVAVMVSLLAVAAAILPGCLPQGAQGAPAGAPRLSGDLVVATGAIPGDPSTRRQRVSYEASFTNTGTVPVRGWTWDVVLPPALQARVIREEHRADPDPRSSPAPLDLNPGETVRLTGYIDVDVGGTPKQQLAASTGSIVVRIIDQYGQEVARLPGHPIR